MPPPLCGWCLPPSVPHVRATNQWVTGHTLDGTTFTVPLIVVLLILSSLVTPAIQRSILISVIFILFSLTFFTDNVAARGQAKILEKTLSLGLFTYTFQKTCVTSSVLRTDGWMSDPRRCGGRG